MIRDRFLIEIRYNDMKIGYACATNPTYQKSDSIYKPNAAIGLFTEKGANTIISALKKNWKTYSKSTNEIIPMIKMVSIQNLL